MGYYSKDMDKRVCERCHFSCQSCTGRHSMQCTTCTAGFFKQGSSCVAQCSDRSDKHTTVLLFSHLKQNPTLDFSLLSSHFGNSSTMVCDRCDPSCNQCLGRGNRNCLSCREDFVLVKKWAQCLQSCPSGFYLAEKTCYKCHPTCKTCSGKDNLLLQ